MSKSEQNNLIKKKLLSNNIKEVLFTINKLRNTGSKEIVPSLIDLMSSSKSEEVKKSVLGLLYDIKYQTAVVEIINAISSDKYLNIRTELLTICWQSSLDFSNYIDVLTDIFITGNFTESFEAFTAIESIEEKLDSELVKQSIANLKSVISTIDDSKKELLAELVHVIEAKELRA